MGKRGLGFNFKKYYPLYKVLNDKKKYGSDISNAIIKQMKPKHHCGLNEAVDMALNKNIPLCDKSVKVLKKHANELKKYKLSKKDHKKQKQMLKKHSQKGGFLPFLIPIVSGLVSMAAKEGISAVVKAVKKKKKKH